MRLSSFLAVSALIGLAACSVPDAGGPTGAFEDYSGPYFGLTTPGASPRLFMPGLVSTQHEERSVCFLADGTVCVIVRDHETVFTFELDGRWTAPRIAPFSFGDDMPDCTAGPDGRTLVFMTSRPLDVSDASGTHHPWTIRWNGSSWEPPKPLPNPEKIPGNGCGYPTLTADGTVYFISDARNGFQEGGIYRCLNEAGRPSRAELVEPPINSAWVDFDPCVAPDETYLVFNSNRPGGFGSWDTYISFRRSDGSWMPPVNLGPGFNSSAAEACPTLSPDGRYLFFVSTRRTEANRGAAGSAATRVRNRDTYWVDASFIDQLRSRYLGTESSATRVIQEYRENGVKAAVDSLGALYSHHRTTFSFLPTDLLRVCEEMISAGQPADADLFYEALIDTLPETARLKLGYALISAMNGDPAKGLEIVQETDSSDPALDFEEAYRRQARRIEETR